MATLTQTQTQPHQRIPPSSTRQAPPGPPTLETFEDKQSNVLPHKKLMVVFPAIALAQFTSYLDQTSVSTALPAIASGLNLGSSISWAASSFLIASTVVQLINGRLSDIFGRKKLLMMSLAILGFGNLLAGFSKTPAMLFASRAISGLGGGAINALVMTIASDITTLKDRGKYNGFIGAMVAFGNGLGPLIGGAVTQKASWRWSFWFIVPLITLVITVVALVLPKSPVSGSTKSKLKMIDWAGLVCNTMAVLLVLIPLSEGGASFAWNSPTFIGMMTAGIVLVLTFILIEWKYANLPLMPLRIYTNDLSANIILIQGVLTGFVYWGNLFYLPVYFQNVLGYDPILSGALILPLVCSHGIGSIISGQIISKTGHYNPVIITSQFVWAVGISLQALYSPHTPVWAICVIGFVQGIGIGGSFQPSLVALLAHSRKADRAVINSARNFLRTIGGAVGLTVSGTILSNIISSRLKGSLSPSVIAELTSSVYSLSTLDLTPAQHSAVLAAYMKALHTIFIIYAPFIGICAISSLFVKDNGVAEKDATKAERMAGTGTENEGIMLQDMNVRREDGQKSK